MQVILQDLLEWFLKYWIAFTVGILIPLGKWFHGKLKHQDELTRQVEKLEGRFEDLDDKFDKFCEDQRKAEEKSDERNQILLDHLTDMKQQSMDRHVELKESIAEVRLEAAVNKAKIDR